MFTRILAGVNILTTIIFGSVITYKLYEIGGTLQETNNQQDIHKHKKGKKTHKRSTTPFISNDSSIDNDNNDNPTISKSDKSNDHINSESSTPNSNNNSNESNDYNDNNDNHNSNSSNDSNKNRSVKSLFRTGKKKTNSNLVDLLKL
jgi:hypothetical protein